MKKIIILLLFFQIGFSQDTIVKPKQSVVALDKLNVVYRGIENPISIAVTNAKSFRIYGEYVIQNEDGSYIILPGVGNETKVFVEITNHDNSIVTEEHLFKVIKFPIPKAIINNHYTTNGSPLEFTIDEIKDALIEVKFIDFLFPYNFEVEMFNLKIPGFKPLKIVGNKINKESLELIKKVKKNDLIIIYDIKCTIKGIRIIPNEQPPLCFKIIEE